MFVLNRYLRRRGNGEHLFVCAVMLRGREVGGEGREVDGLGSSVTPLVCETTEARGCGELWGVGG